jgi:hypothetical protein
VDADGRVAGVLSIEALSHALSVPAEHVPSATELALSHAEDDADESEEGA